MIFMFLFLTLLLKVTKVTTDHQILPKFEPKKYKKVVFAQRAKKGLTEGQSPLQELEEGAHRGPHLLVSLIIVLQY